jgi:hypothetical protein
MDLRDAAQELYTVSPRDFTTERLRWYAQRRKPATRTWPKT